MLRTFRLSNLHLSNNISSAQKTRWSVKRHNSTLPAVLSYMKDKGTEIPFAHKILTNDEYERYTLYTRVKKGDYRWLKTYVEANPLLQEEKITMIKYINGLKEQPYSVPNLGIGYISAWFGLSSIYYSVTGVLVPLLGNTTINTYYLQFLGNMTTTGSILLECIVFIMD
jgi:hypothetical protein